jgi:hypothetical protein
MSIRDGADRPELDHLRQAQARLGYSIGGIKSCLKDSRGRESALEARVERAETIIYAISAFLAVFCCAYIAGCFI